MKQQKTYAITRLYAGERQYLTPGPIATPSWTKDKDAAARLSALRFAVNVANAVGGRPTNFSTTTAVKPRRSRATEVCMSHSVFQDTTNRIHEAWGTHDFAALTRAIAHGRRRAN